MLISKLKRERGRERERERERESWIYFFDAIFSGDEVLSTFYITFITALKYFIYISNYRDTAVYK